MSYVQSAQVKLERFIGERQYITVIQHRLVIGRDHLPVNKSVVRRVRIDNEELTIARHDMGVAPANRCIVPNEIINKTLFLPDTEDGLVK